MSGPAPRRGVALGLALAIVVAACGDGRPAPVAPTAGPAPTGAPTTGAPSTGAPTTSEAPVPAVAPLTGLAVTDRSSLDHPALVLKIDNHPDGRPQSGLERADLVLEVRAEGVTRFAAVFHTERPAGVGPVRSSRTSDFDLLRALGRPLYGSSGGNDHVMAALRDVPVVDVTTSTRTEYYRDPARRRPHNLYVDTADLFLLAPDDGGPPPAWFDHRAEGEALPPSARPVDGEVVVRWTPRSGWTWDPARRGWARTQDGRPHVPAGEDDPLAPANVVILEATYTTSPADPTSPELRSTGTGRATVLTDGHVVTGRWSRPTPRDRPELVTDDGDPIALTPGRTWVQWPEVGDVALPAAETH